MAIKLDNVLKVTGDFIELKPIQKNVDLSDIKAIRNSVEESNKKKSLKKIEKEVAEKNDSLYKKQEELLLKIKNNIKVEDILLPDKFVETPNPTFNQPTFPQQSLKAKPSTGELLEPISIKEFSTWDGRTNPLKDMDWIWQNLGVADISPDQAPSPGAYSFYRFIQSDYDVMKDFYKLYINRRLPSRDAIEDMENKMNDDGRDLLEWITSKVETTSKKLLQ